MYSWIFLRSLIHIFDYVLLLYRPFFVYSKSRFCQPWFSMLLQESFFQLKLYLIWGVFPIGAHALPTKRMGNRDLTHPLKSAFHLFLLSFLINLWEHIWDTVFFILFFTSLSLAILSGFWRERSSKSCEGSSLGDLDDSGFELFLYQIGNSFGRPLICFKSKFNRSFE